MKNYQITFNVPDDFNPDEMDLNVDYKDNIALADEGFTDELDEIRENFEKKIESFLTDKLKISPVPLKEGDVVILEYPSSMSDEMELVQTAMHYVEDKTGMPTLALLDDIHMLVQYHEQAVDMLEKMIQKIKTQAMILGK